MPKVTVPHWGLSPPKVIVQNVVMPAAANNHSDATGADTRDSLGRPLQDLRISLIDRCNFRCPYCMPESKYPVDYQFLSRAQKLSHAEILKVARVAVSLGVSKLRLTGGEPLLDKNVASLLRELSRLQGVDDLALTTNAVLLAPIAEELAAAGLQRVTVSLDSLDADVFSAMSGHRGDIATVLRGIEAAENAGLTPIKINTVVQRGVNDHTLLELLEHFRGTPHVVRLIEYMDVGNRNGWTPDQVVPSKEVLHSIHRQWPLRAVGRNYPGEVARRYEYLDGQGEIGFISSVTEPFCGACSRARLSAEGVLYTCLFATAGTNLREPLRAGANDAELAEILKSVWLRRSDRYSETRHQQQSEKPLISKVEMYHIGG